MPDATAKIEDLPLATHAANAAIEATQDGSAVKIPLALMAVRAETWVISRSRTSPPSNPSEDDRYLVANDATGDWTNLDECIVQWVLDGSGGGSWYSRPPAGILFILDEGVSIFYDGTSWNDISALIAYLAKLNLRVVSADADVVVTDETIEVDASGGDITITFDPSVGAKKRVEIVKIDNTGNAVNVSDGSGTLFSLATPASGSVCQSVFVHSNGSALRVKP